MKSAEGRSHRWRWSSLLVLCILCYGHADPVQAHQSAMPLSGDSFQRALDQARRFRSAGDFAKAEHMFLQAALFAKQGNKQEQQAQALLFASGCEIRQFHYGAALRTIAAARQVATSLKDTTVLGALATNSSTVYFQLGDIVGAARTAAESVQLLKSSPRRDYFARSLIGFGDIEFGLGRHSTGLAAFTQAMEVAKEAKLYPLEAFAANHLSAWLIIINDLASAKNSLARALTVGESQHDENDLAETYEHLAELNWHQGGAALPLALTNIDKAFAAKSELFADTPRYYPLHIRGQILLSLGRRDQALTEFRVAVNAADNWRQSALPGDTTNTRTVAQLDEVYRDFAQLAAEIALQRDDHALARDALEVLSRNRAASLREQLTRSYSSKLLDSPEYFSLLQQLQGAQASTTLENDFHRAETQRQQLDEIRAKLSDLGNRLGLDQQNLFRPPEKKGSRNSLKGIQARLSPSEALFSFSLGEHESFLWAVTNSDIRLYQLPNQRTIATQAEAFSRAVSINSPSKGDAGRALCRSLFANIAPSLKSKPNWLLTPDGALLDKVPFSALPSVLEGSDKPLIATHTIRLIPSALLLQAVSRPMTSHSFIGVADPIYNLADSRREHNAKNLNVANVGKPKKSPTVLGRLVASENEIRLSAEQCGLTQTRMLTGKEASSLSLRRLTQQSPEILHFAVHVISPKDFPQEAALALSLTKDNLPELLTAESAATFHVPGSLVVLSGCASQQGEVLPGAGLVGLSRGWLLAGAAAVIVSAWPTPDASGSFFPTFYSHYRKAAGSVGMRAAIALQQTQLDMQRGGGYQNEPSFWAAYSIISKE